MEYENVRIRYRDITIRNTDLDVFKRDSIDKNYDIVITRNGDHPTPDNEYMMFEMFTVYLYTNLTGTCKAVSFNSFHLLPFYFIFVRFSV